MGAFEILVAIYMALVPPALGYLFWGRLNRLESRIDAFDLKVASEFALLRAEMRQEFSDFRSEITAMRSDLTHVALAVGTRPRSAGA